MAEAGKSVPGDNTYGFHSAKALIALVMLSLGGFLAPLLGR